MHVLLKSTGSELKAKWWVWKIYNNVPGETGQSLSPSPGHSINQSMVKATRTI